MKSKMLLLVILCLVTSCAMRKVKCTDGEKVFVPRHPEEAYKPYARELEANLVGTAKLTDRIELSNVAGNVKTEVISLREQLNQYSSQCENIIKASFQSFSSHPCDTVIRNYHYNLLKLIAIENAAVEKLNAGITDVISSGNMAGIDDAKLKSIIDKYNQNNVDNLFK